MIEIDGSEKSGSGTIVRYAVGLSSLLGADLHLKNIRVKREKQGLRPQHLKAVQACVEMTEGKAEGLEVGSKEILYYPKERIRGGKYIWDIQTAGSTTMLAETVLPLAAFADSSSHFTIKGGLFQDFAPAAHHLQHVVFPLYRRMGIHAELKVIIPGYVPTGGGVIEVVVHPVSKVISPIDLPELGDVQRIKGIALSSHLKERNVSKRMIESCLKELSLHNYSASITSIDDTASTQRGASLTIYASTDKSCILGADVAGALGRTSEFIGEKTAKMLVEDLEAKATVDRFTADQLILYAALADGISHYIFPKMTAHIETNLWLIEKILKAKKQIRENKLYIEGVGFSK